MEVAERDVETGKERKEIHKEGWRCIYLYVEPIFLPLLQFICCANSTCSHLPNNEVCETYSCCNTGIHHLTLLDVPYDCNKQVINHLFYIESPVGGKLKCVAVVFNPPSWCKISPAHLRGGGEERQGHDPQK